MHQLGWGAGGPLSGYSGSCTALPVKSPSTWACVVLHKTRPSLTLGDHGVECISAAGPAAPTDGCGLLKSTGVLADAPGGLLGAAAVNQPEHLEMSQEQPAVMLKALSCAHAARPACLCRPGCTAHCAARRCQHTAVSTDHVLW